MKSPHRHLVVILVAIVLIVCPMIAGHGQSEGQAADDILMESQTDPTKSVVIKSGAKLIVTLNDGSRLKGELTDVADSSFTLGSKEIPFSKTARVKVNKGEGSKIAGIGGIILGLIGGVLGFLLGWAGFYLTENSSASVDGCVEVFFGILLLVLGITIGIMAAIFLIIGLVAYSVGKAAGRSFSMEQKWRMKHKK